VESLRFRMDLEQNGCKYEVQWGGGDLVSTTINSTKTRNRRKFLDYTRLSFFLRKKCGQCTQC